MSFEKLKRLDLDRIDLDEAVGLIAEGEAMEDVYATRSLETPEWLTNNLRELNREVNNRVAESREKALRETELELAGLRTREERRAELQAKAERLKTALGRPAVSDPAKP